MGTNVMANGQHLNILRKQAAAWAKWKQENPRVDFWRRMFRISKEESDPIVKEIFPWNNWRCEHPEIQPDLSGVTLVDADLSRATLRGVNLSKARLIGVNLEDAYCEDANFAEAQFRDTKFGRGSFRRTNFHRAHFWERLVEGNTAGGAHLAKIDFVEADFSQAYLFAADFYGAFLTRANFSRATLTHANFSTAKLIEADLSNAGLSGANFAWADLSGARLCGALLRGTHFVEANLQNADISNSRIYGVSAWDVSLEGANQTNLIITRDGKSTITVDNLEVAQFIYLLLNNQNLRNVIDTIARKAVLILGRFTPERKATLDTIREELRKHDYLPILFDFDIPESRDITETVTLLARMARFIIADLTEPSSIPKELEAIVPTLAIPVQPLIEGVERPYSMFSDYWKYDWVLKVCRYEGVENLVGSLYENVISPAEHKVKELVERRSTRAIP